MTSQHKTNLWHEELHNKSNQYLHNPSSVKSTLMMKNIKPRAPSFCPPTRVFTQPATFQEKDNKAKCVAFLLKKLYLLLVVSILGFSR